MKALSSILALALLFFMVKGQSESDASSDLMKKAMDTFKNFNSNNSMANSLQNKIAIEIMKQSLNDMISKEIAKAGLTDEQSKKLKEMLSTVQSLDLNSTSTNSDIMKTLTDALNFPFNSTNSESSNDKRSNENDDNFDAVEAAMKEKLREFLEGKESDMSDFSTKLVKKYLDNSNTEKNFADILNDNKDILKKAFEDKEMQNKIKEMAEKVYKSGVPLGAEKEGKQNLESTPEESNFFEGFWVATTAFCLVLVIFFGVKRYIKRKQLKSQMNSYGYIMPSD